MKKIILLALAALLIFTMVSCDGNADFLLWGDEKYIILEFNVDGYSFDSSDTTVKTFKWVLEDNPSTFGDLVGKTVNYYYQGIGYTITITELGNEIDLDYNQPGVYFYFDGIDGSVDEPISYGSTYVINVGLLS
ncbi:MAG: hypothetical protein IJ836_02770 [Spirochaetales bacterium]|nr:hypothetical protein [Spirochaetales bacterium]